MKINSVLRMEYIIVTSLMEKLGRGYTANV